MSTQIDMPGSVVIATTQLTTPYLLITDGGVLCDGTIANKPFGITQNETPIAVNLPVPIRFPGAGTFKVQAAAAIGVDQRVYAAAGGQVSKTVSPYFLGYSRTAATAQNDIIEISPPGPRSTLLNEVIAASSTITNVGTETTFSNANLTLPANELQPGDVINVFATVYQIARNSTDTLRIRLYFAGTVIFDTTAAAFATADSLIINATIIIRTDGATGTWLAIGQGDNVLAAGQTRLTNVTQSTAIDTTSASANVIKITALQGTANAGNQVRLDRFEILRESAG